MRLFFLKGVASGVGMQKFFFYSIVTSVILFASVSFPVALKHAEFRHSNVGAKHSCDAAGGDWYNTICWREWGSYGRNLPESPADLLAFVDSELADIKKVRIIFGEKIFLLGDYKAKLYNKSGRIVLITKNGDYSVVITERGGDYAPSAAIYKINLFAVLDNSVTLAEVNLESFKSFLIAEGKVITKVTGGNRRVVMFSGQLSNSLGEGMSRFSVSLPVPMFFAGNSRFVINNFEAHLYGTLGMRTYRQLFDITRRFPRVRTIVLRNVSGSVNDDINMRTGKLLRASSLNTKVLSDSIIASGGVDLFVAGNIRFLETGAMVGVHSWCCIRDIIGADLPEKHPAHKDQLAYFRKMLEVVLGPRFYFYKIKSARADGIHWMDKKALKKWGIATHYIH